MARSEVRQYTGATIGPDGEDQVSAQMSNETTQLFYFAGRPVARLTSGPELLYLTTDHLGTPVLATDSSGAAVWAGGVEAFGKTWTAGPDNPDPDPIVGGSGESGQVGTAPALGRLASEKVFLRYPGQWVSDAFRVTGGQEEIYYNVHRWYGAGVGRYSQPDRVNLGMLENAWRDVNLPIDPLSAYHLSMLRTGNPKFEHAFGNSQQSPLVYGDPLGLFGPGALATVGGTCVAIDGPIPAGDIVGVPLLLAAGIWWAVTTDWWDNPDDCDRCDKQRGLPALGGG